ncbi:MAG: hypothetical protein LIP03_06835 [Bacteroidales bacterium]|nr:hypothetical protein [Bacteroidales bacterium]
MNVIKKRLIVKPIESLEQIETLQSHPIAFANWVEYPTGPATKFQIGLLDKAIVVRYTVREKNPRAVNTKDLEPVWEDSCVEFFCQRPNDRHYYNFEFNSNGVCVASSRLGQNEGVEFLSPEQLASIERVVKKADNSWSLTAVIPLSIMGVSVAETPILMGNFYKCGDKTDKPHFLSWSPIVSPTPRFHCPEYFGKIKLV